jgi:hypothetical protein
MIFSKLDHFMDACTICCIELKKFSFENIELVNVHQQDLEHNYTHCNDTQHKDTPTVSIMTLIIITHNITELISMLSIIT